MVQFTIVYKVMDSNFWFYRPDILKGEVSWGFWPLLLKNGEIRSSLCYKIILEQWEGRGEINSILDRNNSYSVLAHFGNKNTKTWKTSAFFFGQTNIFWFWNDIKFSWCFPLSVLHLQCSVSTHNNWEVIITGIYFFKLFFFFCQILTWSLLRTEPSTQWYWH